MATIREYFDSDFGYTAKIHCRILVGKSTVEARVLYDFAGYKAFLACYMPGESLTLTDYTNLLKAIHYGASLTFDGKVTLPSIQQFPGALKIHNLPNTIEVLARFHGDPNWVSTSEIATSTSVLIYSESDLGDNELLRLKDEGRALGHHVQLRSPLHAEERTLSEVPLAFISYDSRDRDFAHAIAVQLRRMMCPVWYDEFSLMVGDNLRDKIEKGLKECRKCVLILSPNFFSNGGWTRKEFDSIFTREILEQQNLVLPVWHGVTKVTVYDYSPSLLNVKGVEWTLGEDEVCRRLSLAITDRKPRNWSTL
jgi:hypothetical protein